MPIPTYERCPAHLTEPEYGMFLEDKPRDIPTYRQPTFPPDHSRREWIEYEREQLAKANNQPHLRLDVLCLVAAMKHADLFWRDVLASKIDALFFTERERDYEQDTDHQRRCKQLDAAKRAAGYPVHSAR